jgi:hypothetical protein
MFPPVDPTRRRFLTVAAGGAMSIAAVSATALPVEADAELVNAARDLEAIDHAIEDLHRKYDDADSRGDYRALGVRRNENIATLVTVPAASSLGIQAKASALRSQRMIEDWDQHQQIAVSLADDLVGGIPLAVPALTLAPTRAAALSADPIYAAIEHHRAAGIVWNAAVDVRAVFPESSSPLTDEEWEQRDTLDEALEDARDALDKTGVDLISTMPTTVGGIASAIAYIQRQMRDDGTFMPFDIQFHYDVGYEGDSAVVLGWIDAFLNTIAAAVSELDTAVQS